MHVLRWLRLSKPPSKIRCVILIYADSYIIIFSGSLNDRQGRAEQPTCVSGERPQIVVLNFIDMVNFN